MGVPCRRFSHRFFHSAEGHGNGPWRDQKRTKIICYLKEDQSEFLEERRLEDLVNNHSEFIGVSIELYVEKSKEMEVMNFEDEQVSALDEHL